MQIQIHSREKHPFTDLMLQELGSLGHEVVYVDHLLDTTDKPGSWLVINWPHLFYHKPLGAPQVLPSLRRLWGWLFRLRQLKSRGINLAWIVHNVMPHERTSFNLDLFIRRKLVAMMDLSLAFCNHAFSELETLTGMKILNKFTLPFPPAEIDFKQHTDRDSVRNKYDLKPRQRLIVAMGMWRRYKGFEDLITIFKAINDDNARLILWGQPTLELPHTALMSLAGNDSRIKLIPSRYSNEEIAELLSAADWTIHPYRNITTSGTAVTSIILGCPVILPDIGCLSSLVPPEAALFYENGNLGAALRTALATPDNVMASKRKAALNAFDETNVRIFAQELEQALARYTH